MSKLTPAVSRLAAVLELFARDASKSWSLSEIVAELGISRSTCHALLSSLDLANLVYRDEDKRYALGSLAVAVGRAAAEHYSPAELVVRELAQISREWGTISVTNYRRRDGILIREWVDPVHHKEATSRRGAHPARAAMGRYFLRLGIAGGTAAMAGGRAGYGAQ